MEKNCAFGPPSQRGGVLCQGVSTQDEGRSFIAEANSGDWLAKCESADLEQCLPTPSPYGVLYLLARLLPLKKNMPFMSPVHIGQGICGKARWEPPGGGQQFHNSRPT
jgi:hypothetical protein